MDLLAVQGTLKSSPTPQLENINCSAFSFLYGPPLTSVHDYWKDLTLVSHGQRDWLTRKNGSESRVILNSLSLHFLICKVGIMMLALQGEWRVYVEAPKLWLQL